MVDVQRGWLYLHIFLRPSCIFVWMVSYMTARHSSSHKASSARDQLFMIVFTEGAPALARPSETSTTICRVLRSWYDSTACLLLWCDSRYSPLSLLNEEIIIRSLRTSRQVVWLACRQCHTKAQAPDYITYKAMTWKLLGRDVLESENTTHHTHNRQKRWMISTLNSGLRASIVGGLFGE